MEYTEKLQAAQIATCRVRATAPRRVAVLGAIRFTKHLPIIFLKFFPQGTEAITKYLYLIRFVSRAVPSFQQAQLSQSHK